ncbi:MAG: hypothetical protein GY696_22090 [Gammaproteobacteria bacterium]|nr:hypothetical protein [Gammaproteobacteria bacterium]
MAQQLLTEMSALQAENAKLLQQFETMREANQSMREVRARLNLYVLLFLAWSVLYTNVCTLFRIPVKNRRLLAAHRGRRFIFAVKNPQHFP